MAFCITDSRGRFLLRNGAMAGKKARDVATRGVWRVTCGALRLRALSRAHRLIAAAIILPELLKKVFWLILLRHRVGEGALGSQQGRLGRILTFMWSLF